MQVIRRFLEEMLELIYDDSILGIGLMSKKICKRSYCLQSLVQEMSHKRTGSITTGLLFFVLIGLEATVIPSSVKKGIEGLLMLWVTWKEFSHVK